jgi:hypothetical protein
MNTGTVARGGTVASGGGGAALRQAWMTAAEAQIVAEAESAESPGTRSPSRAGGGRSISPSRGAAGGGGGGTTVYAPASRGTVAGGGGGFGETLRKIFKPTEEEKRAKTRAKTIKTLNKEQRDLIHYMHKSYGGVSPGLQSEYDLTDYKIRLMQSNPQISNNQELKQVVDYYRTIEAEGKRKEQSRRQSVGPMNRQVEDSMIEDVKLHNANVADGRSFTYGMVYGVPKSFPDFSKMTPAEYATAIEEGRTSFENKRRIRTIQAGQRAAAAAAAYERNHYNTGMLSPVREDEYLKIPKRRISSRSQYVSKKKIVPKHKIHSKSKTRSQAAKKAIKHKVRKTRKDKGVKRGHRI